MNDVIVSVRMPKGLANKLREIAETQHYMDVSEVVRCILRKHYLEGPLSKKGGEGK